MQSFLIAFALIFSLPALAEEGLPTKLPALPVEGTPVGHLFYADKTGVHVVVVTRTELSSRAGPDEELSSRKLFGYDFVRTGSAPKEHWTLVWRTQDFVTDCAFDLELALEPGSLAVSDVDGDGVKETRFAYRLGCRSDVSPLELKLLFHEGKQKLAVRGSTREQVGADASGKPEYVGGEHKLDPAFAKAPKGLEALAEREWRRLTGR